MYMTIDKIKKDSSDVILDYKIMEECDDCKLTDSDKEHCEYLLKIIREEADLIEENIYKLYRDIGRLKYYIDKES